MRYIVLILILMGGVSVPCRTLAQTETVDSLQEAKRQLDNQQFQAAYQTLNHLLLRQSDVAEAYFLRGQVRAALNQHESALEDYTMAMGLQPFSARIRLKRAQSFQALKLYNLAKKDLEGVVTS